MYIYLAFDCAAEFLITSLLQPQYPEVLNILDIVTEKPYQLHPSSSTIIFLFMR